jgi:hypothetical protein
MGWEGLESRLAGQVRFASAVDTLDGVTSET